MSIPMTKKPTYAELTQRIKELEHIVLDFERIAEMSEEREKHWRDLVNHAAVGIYQVTAQGNFILVNPKFAQMFGYESPEELIESIANISELYVRPEDRPPILQEMKAKGFVDRAEARFRCKDGQSIWVRIIARAIQEPPKETIYEGCMVDITDRIQYQHSLRVSEDRYRSLYNRTPVMLHSIDPRGRLLSVSNYWLDVFGYNREEVIGRKLTDFMTDTSRRYAEDVIFPEFFKTGFCKDVSYQMVTRNGVILDVLLSSTAERDDNNEIVRTLAVMIDVTDRKKAEIELAKYQEHLEELVQIRTAELEVTNRDLEQEIAERKLAEQAFRVSESRLNEAQRIAHVGTWDQNFETGEFFWSEEQYRIRGLEPGEIVPNFELVRNQLHPDDSEYFFKRRTAAFNGQEPFNIEYRIIRKDGAVRTVHSIARVEFDQTGKPKQVFGTLQDITQRKIAEAALKESERQYRVSIESAPYGIMVHSADGNILIYNSYLENIFGYAKEEIPDTRTWFEKLYPDEKYRRILIEDRKKGMRKGKLRVKEASITRKCGKVRICQFSSILLTSGIRILFINDVTEQKLAETALRKSKDELEHRIKERTRELEIQTKHLEEVNTALRVLLSRRNKDKEELEEKVLHNIEELVLPYVERLVQTNLNSRQKSFVDILGSNLNDITSSFSRSLSMKFMHLTPSEVQIANLLKQGRTTKEIAELLTLSARTIETHRKNIRQKLGLNNKKANLRTHLMTIQ